MTASGVDRGREGGRGGGASDSAPRPSARVAAASSAHGWDTRPLLWTAFCLVHLGLAALDLFAPGKPMGDVTRQYRDWARVGLVDHLWVGIDAPWVYPVLALAPVVAAATAGFRAYPETWLALIAVLDALAFAVLLGPRGRVRAPRAAWWWLAFLALIGPIALARLDSVTVPLALAGMLLLVAPDRFCVHDRAPGHASTVAGVLLAAGAWIKVWPAALLLAALVAVRGGRRRVLAGALGTTVVVVGFACAAGGALQVLSFVTEQTSRGLQIEAPLATPWMWAVTAHAAQVRYDPGLNTFEVRGPGSAVAAALSTPLLVVAVLALVLLGVRAVRRPTDASDDRHPHDAHLLLSILGLGLVAAFIATNKVGSPQYLVWLAVPISSGLAIAPRRFLTPAVLGLASAALTQVVYPYLYSGVSHAVPAMVAVLTVRNGLVLALLGWSVVALLHPQRTVPRGAVPRRASGAQRAPATQ